MSVAPAPSMSGLMRGFKLFAALCVTGLLAGPVMGEAEGEGPAVPPPKRVVSMNLCTDQLAMLVAGPGQLHSVSFLAVDPRGSAMAAEAEAYTLNRGLAEEIYLMQPDLVIAGSFSHRATVDMIQRLGIPVALFEPAYGLSGVRDRLAQMGRVLGQEAKAERLVADYDRRLAALQHETTTRPSAALYYANSYTSGDHTLAGQILTAAGFENAAAKAGYHHGGVIPLEVLTLIAPDALILGQRYPGASRSEEILDHPVVQLLQTDKASGAITDRDWVCGTPYVLRAIEGLDALRRNMGEG